MTTIKTIKPNGAGTGAGNIYWRGSATSFAQDAVLPNWTLYASPVLTTLRFVQLRVECS